MAFDPSSSGWKPRSLDGFFGLVGPLWTKREEGTWAYGLNTDATHANPAGVIHGGALATLVDHAFSAIGWEAVGRKPCVTIQIDVQFVASVKPGEFVEARGRIVRQTSKLIFLQGGLTVNGNEIAAASAILRVLNSDKKA